MRRIALKDKLFTVFLVVMFPIVFVATLIEVYVLVPLRPVMLRVLNIEEVETRYKKQESLE